MADKKCRWINYKSDWCIKHEERIKTELTNDRRKIYEG